LSDRSEPGTSVSLANVVHQCLIKPCSGEMLKSTLERIFALRRVLTGKALKRLVSGMTNLPSLPASYRRLVERIDSPRVGTSEIGELIVHDLAMTAKILHLANSAFFGVPHRVTDPAEAIQYLGVETLKALVLTAGVFTQFEGSRRTSLSLERLQQHSLDTGRLARMIAVRENLARPIVDAAFAAGLLHDIGKLILITKDAEMYDRALGIVRRDSLPLDRVEREVFGANHAEAGSYLLWLWALPEMVTEAVAFHHQPAQCPAKGTTAVTLVHAADALVHESSLEPAAFAQLDQTYLDSLGLRGRLPEWREIVRDTFSHESGEH
jgi:HD-like signal output (HDOD) protein